MAESMTYDLKPRWGKLKVYTDLYIWLNVDIYIYKKLKVYTDMYIY